MDFRLVVPALVVWVVTLIGLCGPGWSTPCVTVLSGMGCVAAVVVCAGGRFGWNRIGLLVVGTGLAATCAGALWLRMETRADHPLSEMTGKTTVSMIIRDDPRNFGPAARGQVTTRVTVDVVAGRRVRAGVADLVARSSGWADLSPGQRVVALVSVSPPRGGGLSVARLAARGTPRLVGRPPPVQRIAGMIRNRLQENASRALDGESAGLLPGLVIGDESTLSENVRTEFRAAGLSHLTAVSGANFAIVCGAAVTLIRLLGASPRAAAVFGAIVIVGFVVLVRPSPSVLRAAMMGAVGLLAVMSSRRAHALPALGFAVVGGLLWWPELATQPGFALSVAATAGLVLLAPVLRDRLRDRRVPPAIAEALAIAIAAQIVTAPLIAFISATFNLASIPANVLVAPVVAVISVVGTVAALIGAAGPPDGPAALVAQLLLRSLGPELWWMLSCAQHLGDVRWAVIRLPPGATGMFLVLGVTCVAALIGWRWAWASRRARRVVGSVWHHDIRDRTTPPAPRR
ncbi:ComEC/Rec2 family competence protein [Gordonia sp. NPDC003425]